MTKVSAASKKKAHTGYIPRVYAYLQQGSISPYVDERFIGKEWVYFGKRNLWPEQIIELVENCAPLMQCVNTAAKLIAGDGLQFLDKSGKELEKPRQFLNDVLLQGTTEEEFLHAIAMDVAILNAPALMLDRAAGGDIVRVEHLDVSRLRSGKLQEDGEPETYFWSSNWAKVGRGGDKYAPVPYPRFVPGSTSGENEVIYGKTYFPGAAGDTYAKPWWLGAIPAAEVWTKIDTFNKGQIDTGFSPSVHLHTFTNKPEDELDAYDKKVMQAYSGAMGRGLFHTYGLPDEGAPQITKLERGDHAGELDAIAERCEKVIFKAYGIPPILMGVETTTGMDGAANALKQAENWCDRMLIQPKQQLITAQLVRIMNEIGYKDVWEAKIERTNVFEMMLDQTAYGQAVMASITKDEFRQSYLGLEPLAEGGSEMVRTSGGSQQPQQNNPTTP